MQSVQRSALVEDEPLEEDVVISEGTTEVARHRRSTEPHRRVVDPSRFDGLYRQRDEASDVARSPIGRSLDVYADAVGGGQ